MSNYPDSFQGTPWDLQKPSDEAEADTASSEANEEYPHHDLHEFMTNSYAAAEAADAAGDFAEAEFRHRAGRGWEMRWKAARPPAEAVETETAAIYRRAAAALPTLRTTGDMGAFAAALVGFTPRA